MSLLDCSSCYYPNDDGAQFCVRCAAPLGVSAAALPQDDLLTQPLPGAFEALPGPGSVLSGKYRLLRALGSGGFGAVYEAEQLPLGLRVAIKLLNQASLNDAKVRERFLTEARMVAKLRSPHVVTLQDFAVTPQGIPYLVMELLRGEDLGRALCRGVLPARRSVRIGIVVGPLAFIAIGLAGSTLAGAFLAYPEGFAKPLIVAIELALLPSLTLILALLRAGAPLRPA